MKSSQWVVLGLCVLLSACNSLQQKPQAEGELSKGASEYQHNLDRADASYLGREYSQALSQYQSIHDDYPQDLHVLFRIGNIYSHLDKPKEAIIAYEKVLAVDTKKSKAWYNLGVSYMQQSAKIWRHMSEQIDPKDPLYKSSKHYSRGMSELINPDKS
ncbi:MAG: tetratricopeptide repeat protein [Pseudomonadales bacterium]|nr:tetratricopeptide repeat protein [Pseudomonadales bacterium]NRA15018.1 tetratricopeptide repeat protein [Oceanospirillaceae bacterium]